MKTDQVRGFTLVEMMIVVAIIGLLAVLAMPSFIQARTRGQTSLCVNNLRVIDHAKELFALDEHKYEGDPAPSETDLAPYMRTPAATFKEPTGGTYMIEKIGTPPACSEGNGHVLP